MLHRFHLAISIIATDLNRISISGVPYLWYPFVETNCAIKAVPASRDASMCPDNVFQPSYRQIVPHQLGDTTEIQTFYIFL